MWAGGRTVGAAGPIMDVGPDAAGSDQDAVRRVDSLLTRIQGGALRTLRLQGAYKAPLWSSQHNPGGAAARMERGGLQNLDAVASCANLRELHLTRHVRLSSLASLPMCTRLEHLYVRHAINLVDLSPLALCPALKSFNLSCAGSYGELLAEHTGSQALPRALRSAPVVAASAGLFAMTRFCCPACYVVRVCPLLSSSVPFSSLAPRGHGARRARAVRQRRRGAVLRRMVGNKAPLLICTTGIVVEVVVCRVSEIRSQVK